MKEIAGRVKERNGTNRSGTIKETILENKTKFVRVLWDGEVDVDERQYTSKSLVSIRVKKNEAHAEKVKAFDLAKISKMVEEFHSKLKAKSVQNNCSEEENICSKEILSIKLNKAIVLLKECVTCYNSAIESARRNGNIGQANRLKKAELSEFQKSDGYICSVVQLEGDESLIESSSALVDVIIEQVKTKQVKIKCRETHLIARAKVSSNLSDVDVLNNQNLTSMSNLAQSLAPGTAGIEDHDSDSDIPFDANNPDTFPINIDARLYEVSAYYLVCYYYLFIYIYSV